MGNEKGQQMDLLTREITQNYTKRKWVSYPQKAVPG